MRQTPAEGPGLACRAGGSLRLREEWSTEDLVGAWTLVDGDWDLVANRSGATRLGFALLLKFFEIEARFPTGAGELPSVAVSYVADQVKVDPGELAEYPWDGRSVKYHRVQIRKAFGFREFTRGDEDKLATWLAEEVCPVELRDRQLREALLIRCRAERIEPPGRPDRIIGAARTLFEKSFCEVVVLRLGDAGAARLEDLIDVDEGRRLLGELKADPGQVGLETLLREIEKLTAVMSLDLPDGLFADCSERLVEAWRARAARSYPSDLAAMPRPVRLTLLAALCWTRRAEITDALVDLLLALVLEINTRADRRVERELTEDLRRVHGKERILFRLAEAAVDRPDDTVRAALFPVVEEGTLRDLVKEAKAHHRAYQARVRSVLRLSYTHHHRRMLPPLLAALRFRSNNTAYRPVADALEVLASYAEIDSKARFFAAGEIAAGRVPVEGVVPKAWRETVVDDQDRVERIPYELCALVALRDPVRRREVYVDGGRRWRNPEDDLPGDFEDTREVHYAALRQPTDPTVFVDGLKDRMSAALGRLDQALAAGETGGVRIKTRNGDPWISVPKLTALQEPAHLAALKDEVVRRWGTLDLLDVLKDADFLADFTTGVHLRGHPGTDRPSGPATPAAAVSVRAGHQHGHQGDRVDWGARRDRGPTATHPSPLHHPRQPPARDRETGQCHLRGSRPGLVGHRDGVRERLEEVRVLGVELDDGVAPALRRARGDDLLARRTTLDLHLL